jgi:Bacteriophage HK97-gp10, putative tail-component
VADEITFHWEGIDAFGRALDTLEAAVDEATHKAIVEAAALVEKAAKEHASGAPGPNVVTGDLRRSVVVTDISATGSMGWTARIAPTTSYGRRVELGFHGTDRLGRHYDQAARPFLRPALDELRPYELPEVFRRHWAEAFVVAT